MAIAVVSATLLPSAEANPQLFYGRIKSVTGSTVIGSQLTVTSSFTNKTRAGKYAFATDVYNSSDVRVAHFTDLNKNFQAGQTRSFSHNWNTARLPAGTYTFELRTFDQNSNWDTISYADYLNPVTLRKPYTATPVTTTTVQTTTSTTSTTVKPTVSTTSTTVKPTTTTTTTTTSAPSSGGPVDLTKFKLIFSEDFNQNVNEGSFMNTYGSRFDAYEGGHDTARNGSYSTNIFSVNNGIFNMRLHTLNGVPQVAAPIPKITGTGTDQTYGRYEVRFRADPTPGYATAWLLWPQSEVWPQDGEIDFPEGHLDGTMNAFMHRSGATTGGDQDVFSTNARYNDWHTASMEWTPTSVTFLMDGAVIGKSTERIPSTNMHWVLQTETAYGAMPAPSATANVQIDYVKAWSYIG